MTKKVALLLILSVAVMVLSLGCSDDEGTTTTTGTVQPVPLDLINLQAVIEQVAPPEYVAPSAAPMEVDTIWNGGQHPLLDLVFGSYEPQALYRNIEDFEMKMGILEEALSTDGNGNILTGSHSDSVIINDVMVHYTATVTALSGPTTVPTDAQGVFGSTIDVDYLVEIATDEDIDQDIKLGITLSETEQTVVEFGVGTEDGGKTESRFVYSSMDPTDSSFVFKGVGYVHYGDNEVFSFAFDVSSASTADFAYRMAWVSDPPDTTEFRHCIIGGGNKDVEFALKYRMFKPIDATEPDQDMMYEQVFGPNYTEGTSLITAFSDYVSDALLYSADDMPSDHLTDPWAAE